MSRKIVTLQMTAVFEGDYIPVEEVGSYLFQWLNSGLEDRDDLVNWDSEIIDIFEEEE